MPILEMKVGMVIGFIQNAINVEVVNNGASATFTATAKLVKGHPNHLNELYTLYWDPQGADVVIGQNGTGKLIIALQTTITSNPFTIGLAMLQVNDKGKSDFYEGIWGLDQTGAILQNKLPQDVETEISIVATDKKMRKQFRDLKFRLSQQSITSLEFEYIECKTRKLILDKEGYWN